MDDRTLNPVDPVVRAVDRLTAWGVQVLDAEKHALADAHEHGHLSDVMALLRRAWETPHPGEGHTPTIPEQIQRRRQLEEARRFPTHRAEKPAPVLAFEQRAETFTEPQWTFIDDQAGFQCLLCGEGFGRYAHPDSVMAAADDHTATCKRRGGAA